MTPMETVKLIYGALDDKKAQDIKAIGVRKITTLADYFVIATATSTTHIKALTDEVEHRLSQAGIEPRSIEGYFSATWIVIDYYDVIVHIFLDETRRFYSLEKLWADGVIVPETEFEHTSNRSEPAGG